MELMTWLYYPSASQDVDPAYKADRVLDDYISLIWCERYQKPGEFELVLDATPERLAYFKNNRNMIISRPDSDRAMIVESINLKTNARTGDILWLKGKSLEGLFNRRIIVQTYTIQGGADDVIYHFIDENIGSYWYYHSDAEHLFNYKPRFISMLNLGDHKNLFLDEVIVQPFGSNLGTFTEEMCAAFKIGYKIKFDNGQMWYSLYRGADRTINQIINDPVLFSADFENLRNTDFTIDESTYYSRVIVGGEGEGDTRTIAATGLTFQHGGVELKERYVDKKNVSSKSNGASSYGKLIASIANTTLDASKETVEFYGEALPGGQFKYRRDYALGDTVTVQNPYGITGSAVVAEVVETVDATGYKVIPNFTEWRADE